MSNRELVVLGTASAAPTRERNHNGYALRWDDQLVLFDPGEGFQRQCTLAGVPIARATALCLTHFHGDHCLGLPGVIAKRDMDHREELLPIFYPAQGERILQSLCSSTANDMQINLDATPTTAPPDRLLTAGTIGQLTVEVAALEHRVPTQGYRLTEPDHRHFLVDRLEAAGIEGEAIGELAAHGAIETARGTVRLEDVSEITPGRRFAFVLDTHLCRGAELLADGADLMVCESTFLESERHQADDYGHMTAADAGRLAAAAGVKRLVLTHFSSRYHHFEAFAAEAGRFHDDVWAANDFDRVPFD
ncbi:MAG: ribonuclease Z [Acidimicrobiales bacterium]|nr:ribonuclease Z [Acidimicrobiales bacterium]